MARGKANITKLEIIQVATRLFLEKGFTNTSVKAISDELDISTGNLTFHFPTKEHLLKVLVEMLCDFQWKMMKAATSEGNKTLLSMCLELAVMAATCEENVIMKDVYIAAYTHQMSLETIQKNDAQRAKNIFTEYTSKWTEEQFLEAENLVSGLEYTTLMTNSDFLPLEKRISGALNTIMQIYGVPEEIRQMEIQSVLEMDYRKIGHQITQEFVKYVKEVNEQALEGWMPRNKK